MNEEKLEEVQYLPYWYLEKPYPHEKVMKYLMCKTRTKSIAITGDSI